MSLLSNRSDSELKKLMAEVEKLRMANAGLTSDLKAYAGVLVPPSTHARVQR